MKRIAVMIATLSLATTSWAQGDRTENGRKQMQTANDISMVAPALQKYAQGPLAELWKRPGLTPRDRSIVTIAALIARNQTIEMPHYFNLALDNGVKPREISEIITHLAFYSGWANAMSAVAVAKDVFAEHKIWSRPASSRFACASSARQRRGGETRNGRGTAVRQRRSGHRAVHHRRSVSRFVAASGPCATRSQSRHGQCPDCFRPGRAASPPPQSGHGQRPDTVAGRGGCHPFGLLLRLAECLFRVTGPEGCLRETSSLAHLGVCGCTAGYAAESF